jgi:hypothetical protein
LIEANRGQRSLGVNEWGDQKSPLYQSLAVFFTLSVQNAGYNRREESSAKPIVSNGKMIKS